MNTRKIISLMVIVLLCATVVYADVPNHINFQGTLTDSTGTPITGTRQLQFAVYTDSTGGTPLWNETHPLVDFTNGQFSVLIGAANPLMDSLFSGDRLWLGIKVDPDLVELSPRTPLVTVPYGFKSAETDHAAEADLAQHAVYADTATWAWNTPEITRVDTAEYALTSGSANQATYSDTAQFAMSADPDDDWTVISTPGGGYMYSAISENVGIGTDYPTEKLHVVGNIKTDNTLFASNVSSNSPLQLQTAETTRIYIDDVSGDVGIGTTTPDYKLHVEGQAISGESSQATGQYSTVSGGRFGRARGSYSVIAGGGGSSLADSNSALGDNSVVSGGVSNIADGGHATVGGGFNNETGANYATVSGGAVNRATGHSSTVSGGAYNMAIYQCTTVGGGANNKARGQYSVIAGGGGPLMADSNSATGSYSAISGGKSNIAGGQSATVGGGSNNSALSGFSCVPGGYSNTAQGVGSFAAGYRAKANHHGVFVWADSTESDFASTANDQFLVRASGGVGIGTTSPSEMLDVNGTVRMTGFNLSTTGAYEGYVLTSDNNGYGTWEPAVSAPDSDWTIVSSRTGTDMYSAVPGNVGVGTSAPNTKLHIAENANSAVGIRIENTDPGNSSSETIEFSDENGDLAGITLHDEGASFPYESAMKIYNNRPGCNIKLETNNTTRVHIDSSGNVGIGTISPDSKLDVEGGVAIGAPYSGLYPAPTDGMIVKGNVGIGTPSPDNKLDVEGAVAVGATYSGTNTAPTNGMIIEGKVGIGTIYPFQPLYVCGDIEMGGDWENYDGDSEALTIYAQSNDWYLGVQNEDLTSETDFFIGTHLWEDGTFHIERDGDIGIGTTTPEAKLDVNGSAAFGDSGSVFLEIREFTGTTDSAGTYTWVVLPEGYTPINTRVLSIEIRTNEMGDLWRGIGNYDFPYWFGYYLRTLGDEHGIRIQHEDHSSFHNKPFRVILMKMD